MKPQVGLLLLAILTGAARGCGPGRGAGRRRGPSKHVPLVFKQHVPNVSENTLVASGQAEGRISRNDSRFRDLVPNYNQDIVFKDEEGTGADRLMTQRCMEKLNTLAISVMNQWPGVKLRVTEGWDEEGYHAEDSLHYEGRAVDITTSDKDRSKYGLLARLAVEAGFDWVYYESRSHIHCSVKSESSQAARSGGCFTGNSTVVMESGERMRLSELREGDRVLSYDPGSGKVGFSEVIMFLDRDAGRGRSFLRIETESGAVLRVTGSHLVAVAGGGQPKFAGRLTTGDRLLVARGGLLLEDPISGISAVLDRGLFAPLTGAGTVVVDDVVASCYAVVESQWLAHWAFAPVRLVWGARRAVAGPSGGRGSASSQKGVHWYPALLYRLSAYLVPSRLIYGNS